MSRGPRSNAMVGDAVLVEYGYSNYVVEVFAVGVSGRALVRVGSSVLVEKEAGEFEVVGRFVPGLFWKRFRPLDAIATSQSGVCSI